MFEDDAKRKNKQAISLIERYNSNNSESQTKNQDDGEKFSISYPKNSMLESILHHADKVEEHATFARQASGLVKGLIYKDPSALDSSIAQKVLRDNFGDTGYDIIRTIYQKMTGK